MNKIKIAILVLSISLIIFCVNAQGKRYDHDPSARAKKQTEKMKTDLSLSEEQTSKVGAINLKHAQDAKAKKEQMHQEMKNLREQKQKDLEAVLTKEQIEKLKTLQEAEMKKRKESHHQKVHKH